MPRSTPVNTSSLRPARPAVGPSDGRFARPFTRPFTRPFARLLAAAALAALLPGLAAAQSLQELYDAARAYDASYLAAKSAFSAAEFRAAQSDALGRPAVNATAGASTAQVDPPRLGAQSQHNLQAAINARYPLFNRANAASLEQAKKSLLTAQAELDTAEQELIVRVAQAYFDVLAAQDTLTTTRANKAAITEQLASARRNFEVGTATITDTREAQARFDLATAQEIAAENDLRTRRLALDTLVGRSGVAPKPLAAPVSLPPLAPANPEEWVTAADQQHPSVRRARAGLEVAQLETAKSRAAEQPTLDAVASVSSSEASGRLPTSTRSNGTSTIASVGVQMNWPLYTGGQTGNRIKETLALEERSRNELEAARRGVAQGTRASFFGVQSGLARVKALEAAESSSKLALEATQLGYRVGVRVNLDVLNAQRELFQTQSDLAKARYDVIVAGLRLRQASGQLAPADLDAVNRLLAR